MAFPDSSVGRLAGALVAPVRTFRSLAERPTWAVAFLALYLLGSGVAFLAFQKVDFIAGVKEQMAEQGRELPAGAEERMLPIIKMSSMAAIVVLPPLFLFLIPAIYLVFNLVGGELDYRRSLAVALHANLPRALAALLSIPVVLSRHEISLKEVQGGGLLHSNLSYLVPSAGPALRVLLTSCDLFTVWTLALSIVGFHLVAKVGKGTAAAVVLLLWLVGVGIAVGFVLLGAMGGAVKKALLIALGVLVLSAIVFASIRAGNGEKGVKVYAAATKRRDISQVIKASGAIDPKEKVNISAHVIGKIEKLFVQEGDRIKAGAPFLRLEQQAFIAQRDQWAAQLRSAQTAVAKTQAQLADSRVRLERARNLNQQGILSREQLEVNMLQETSARLAVDEAKEAVQQARANLVKAADDLTKTTIYSPLTGRVVKLNAEQGEVVVSGTMNNPGSVIGTIADLSEILAKVDVDETEIVDVKVGQKALVKVDAIPDRQYHGKIMEVGSSGFSKPAQPDVTFFEVKILLDDPDDRLRPGMSVRSEIQAASHAEALVVPIQAVVERPPVQPKGAKGEEGAKNEEIKVVFLVEGGKARQRPVKTGIADETHVEIVSGLKPGESVVTGPYRTLRDLKDGDAVAVSKTSEAEDKKATDKS